MITPQKSESKSRSFSGIFTITFLAIAVAVGAASGDMGLMAIFICLFTVLGIATDSCNAKSKSVATAEGEQNKNN